MVTETISIVVKAISGKAILVIDGDRHDWIPKSLIVNDTDELVVGEVVDLEVQEWFLKKEGYI